MACCGWGRTDLAPRAQHGADCPLLGWGLLGWWGVPPSLSPRPLDGSGTAQGFLRWAVANERSGGCVLSQVSLELGLLLWDPGPNRKRASQTGCQPAPTPQPGRVVSLNLSSLHCKRGMKAPNLRGCDLQAPQGSRIQCAVGAAPEDGPRLVLGEDRQSRLPLRHKLGCLASALWPHPLLYEISIPTPFNPRDNQNSQAPIPLHR